MSVVLFGSANPVNEGLQKILQTAELFNSNLPNLLAMANGLSVESQM